MVLQSRLWSQAILALLFISCVTLVKTLNPVPQFPHL